MKNLWLLSALFALAGSLVLASSAGAENRADAFTLSPLIGGHRFEGNQNIGDDWTYGLGFGYNYDRNWGTELLLHYTNTSRETGSHNDIDVYTGMINGLYHFFPETRFVPYITAGAGAQTRDEDHSETDFLVNYGLGAKWFLTDTVALRGDVRHLLAFDQGVDEISKGHDNLLFSGGLTFQFGAPEAAAQPRPAAAKPAPAPAAKVAPAPAPAPAAGPRDSDNDSVPDDRDQCPGTARGVMVDEKGCPLILSIHIEFDFDKSDIKPEFHDELKRAAEFIAKYQAPKILIAGHTDSIGTDEYNKGLSDRRAAAVRDYLIRNFQLDPDRLVSRGYGESQPIATNETPEGRAQNRRTDIVCCVFIPEESERLR